MDEAVHYLDNAATTPVRPAAVEAMVPLLTQLYANPSGAHRMARQANQVIDESRDTMASVLGCEPGEIVFTGGGTEADNLAVTGSVEAVGGVPVCSAIEHHAVLDPVLHHDGVSVPVEPDGRISVEVLENTLSELVKAGVSVPIVSVMMANNETGVIQPLDEVAEVARRVVPDALLHTDAVQALCWLDVASLAAEFDLISVSAHKFGGPKGVGALVVRGRARLVPLLKGGGQERGRRGGTHNVAGIAAMAVAAGETVAERSEAVPRVGELRNQLVDSILASVDDVVETGMVEGGLERELLKTANIAHLCFPGVASEALLFLLERKGIMASAASSCSSGAMEPSHVLAAMGYSRNLAFGSLRLSLGYGTTTADVAAAAAAVPPAVRQLRREAA